ncbi:hypothetical protein HDE78_001291 [Rhodanobacter sp. K2T2]|nr:hypothetical protein [Rhodanobacter sp. K2T2]
MSKRLNAQCLEVIAIFPVQRNTGEMTFPIADNRRP